MTKKILIIVHQPTSNPGSVGKILRGNGYELDLRCPSNSDELPDTMDNHDGVVVFGGPMSANDSETLPFIRKELDWIGEVALVADRPYLGICLGAQLLARALGAKVSPHPDGMTEIGYFPIMPTSEGCGYFDNAMFVYHWHREGFELPKGAVKLAEGDVFVNQAFRYGTAAYGLQFHPEATRKIVDRWTRLGVDMLSLPGAQSRDEQLRLYNLYAIAMETWLARFLSIWLQDFAITPLSTPQLLV